MATTYKKLTHVQHVLERPDMYVGSTATHTEERWVANADNTITYETVHVNPALLKLFDEVIVNARDEAVRSGVVRRIDIHVTPDLTEFNVTNDGNGIAVAHHADTGLMIPELIFGHLLTSSNYGATATDIGGRNGVGVTCVNILSSSFTVDIKDPINHKHYTQQWRDNMSVMDKPTIRAHRGKRGSVSITWRPDRRRFEMSVPTDARIFYMRALELATTAPSVKIFYNGDQVAIKSIADCVGEPYIHMTAPPHWSVCVMIKNGPGHHHSFVNGIPTRRGGKHVDHVMRHLLQSYCERKKCPTTNLKQHVLLFVQYTTNADEITFDSQTKDFMSAPVKHTITFTDTFIKKLGTLGLDAIVDANRTRTIKKKDGVKSTIVRGIPKLQDAIKAGTAESPKCTLVLTEGDSAATSVLAGLKEVGRDYWGVFPLRGVILNVRDATATKISQNEELCNIKKIIGLEHGRQYTSTASLRYGRVMIVTDADNDGIHIRGLLLNMFHVFWPSLLKCGFICALMTPIIKSRTRSFYTIQEYREAVAHGFTEPVKYYKGLGTSTATEARDWFRPNMRRELTYMWDNMVDQSIPLAFDKKQSHQRKEWLSTYNPNGSMTVPTLSNFIHEELVHFSHADNIRSIPHLMDGLKPSQRKVIYASLMKNDEMRVSQLAGFVAERTMYHHGEQSLCGTIIGMAQDFVGSNNIHLLEPRGAFGSRVAGGKDAASARYIYTRTHQPIVNLLFHPDDRPILSHVDEEGARVEPTHYVPVLPLIVINGATGIGTGYSTDIPPHNPTDVINVLKKRLTGELSTMAGIVLTPWWRGFSGRITQQTPTTWTTHATYTIDPSRRKIVITELPVGVWTNDYKVWLDTLDGFTIIDQSNDTDVHITINGTIPTDYEKFFKLTRTHRTTNMHCMVDGQIVKKYDTVGDMMEEYFGHRIQYYERRRLHRMLDLSDKITKQRAVRSFIECVTNGSIILYNRTDADIVKQLRAVGIPPLVGNRDATSYDSYTYVTNMRMDAVRKTSLATLDQHIRDMVMEHEKLVNLTAGDLWLEDIQKIKNIFK